MGQSRDDKFLDIFLLLCIVTVILLKLTGVITVSWLVLFSPILIIFLLGAILISLAIFVIVTKGIIEMIKENKNERN